jgi:hypothetical protein
MPRRTTTEFPKRRPRGRRCVRWYFRGPEAHVMLLRYSRPHRHFREAASYKLKDLHGYYATMPVLRRGPSVVMGEWNIGMPATLMGTMR